MFEKHFSLVFSRNPRYYPAGHLPDDWMDMPNTSMVTSCLSYACSCSPRHSQFFSSSFSPVCSSAFCLSFQIFSMVCCLLLLVCIPALLIHFESLDAAVIEYRILLPHSLILTASSPVVLSLNLKVGGDVRSA